MRKLTDGYVKQVLNSGAIKLEHYPAGMIKVKRAQLELRRLIIEKETELKNYQQANGVQP